MIIKELELVKISINASLMKFAAGHFTIFSETSRENIHGHNFTIKCSIEAYTNCHGLCIDYSKYKKKISELCALLDEKLLLPEYSPWLQIKEEPKHFTCYFNTEEMRFLKRDVITLPVKNITIEEMASWFLDRIKNESSLLRNDPIHSIEISVASSPSQKGTIKWIKNI